MIANGVQTMCDGGIHGDGHTLSGVLGNFQPTSLAEMDGVALLDRTDTKFVLDEAGLVRTLAPLTDRYRILEIEGQRVHRYRTIYFDAPDFELYRRHHAGFEVRHKVRAREYVDSALSFVEVKQRRHERTVKTRVQTACLVQALPGDGDRLYTRLPIVTPDLEPKVVNEFRRVTLVSVANAERLTLDLGIRFSGSGRECGLPGVVIAEVKQDGHHAASDFIDAIRAAHARPVNVSKYCLAVAMLYPQVKHNRFKPALRLIQKLQEVPNAA